MRYRGLDAVVANHERPVALVKVSHGVNDIGAVVETLEYWDGKGSYHDAEQGDQSFFAVVLERGDIVLGLRADAVMVKRGSGVRKRVYEVGVVAGDKVQIGGELYNIREAHDASYYTGVITLLCGRVRTGG